MAATEYNFSISNGKAYYISFDYKDNNQQTINLTNWCARLSIQPSVGNKITYITDNTNSQYSFIIQPDLGRLILKLPASTTGSFDFPNAVYDLDLKAPNELYPGSGSQIIPLLKGSITILFSNVSDPEPFNCNVASDPDQCLNCE
jgi:hypothetical protein